MLLAERVSIRNLSLILEAIAEIAPHVRRPEQIVEHVRVRMAQQICGDIQDQGALRRAAARQSLGSRLPPKPQARRQGRGDRIRHRSQVDGAIRRRSVRGDPQTHGGKASLRPRHHRRDAALCAHDHRAHVPDVAGACRNSRSRAGSRSKSLGVNILSECGRRHIRGRRRDPQSQRHVGDVHSVLPHRRLPDADAGNIERADTGADSIVHCRGGDAVAAPLLLDQAPLRSLSADPIPALRLIAVESLIGGLIGFLGRLFFSRWRRCWRECRRCSAWPIRLASTSSRTKRCRRSRAW